MKKNNLDEDFLKKLQNLISSSRLFIDEPMSRHTTFKIGGMADCLIMPASTQEVADVVKLCQQYHVQRTILGNGSNLLVLDNGIRGLVIKFGSEMAYQKCIGDKIIAGAGVSLKEIAGFAACSALTGLEFAVGIPGNLGGAVYMNAGAYDGDMSQVVSRVVAVNLDGDIQEFEQENLAFSYRHSLFQDHACAICEIELSLRSGEESIIREKMDEYTGRRESKQPLEMPSAGSTFKRPPGYFAGTLIEQAGLKGLKVGGAQVSTKHAGFIVNAGGATAQDVLDLIKKVQQRVFEHSGVMLAPEVRLIGE